MSAAIVRDGHVLVVRRARPPAEGLYTLPGGRVEAGEMLMQALQREVQEETGLTIEPGALAGYREVVPRQAADRRQGHFVILVFAARWLAGEPRPNSEISECRWVRPAELRALPTTEGLLEIVAAAFETLEQQGY